MNESFRILIIDDNKEIHQDFRKILQPTTQHKRALADLSAELFGEEEAQGDTDTANPLQTEFELASAYQGQEAFKMVEEAKAQNKPFALAFVDIRMPPGWNGVETIEHIWQADPDIQLVICTAYSDVSWNEMSKQLPKSEHLLILKKPFDNVEIRQLTIALTQKWKAQKQLKLYITDLEGIVAKRTQELAQSLALVYAILGSTADGILAVDLNRKIIDYNKKYIDMWNIPETLLSLKKDDEINSFIIGFLKEPEEYITKIRQLYERPEATSLDEIVLKDGRFFERYSQPFYVQNQLAGRVWSFRDATEQRRMQTELAIQATHDKLTGIPNRMLILDRIRHAIQQAARDQEVVSVSFLDLDGFKLVNDHFGHHMGDAVLQTVAKRLLNHAREEDSIGRLGGDEFVIVLKLKKEEDVITPIQNILKAIAEPIKVEDEDFRVTTSIGISFYPKDGKDAENLLKKADIAMYQAKELGRNNFQLYSEEMNQRILQKLTIENDLSHAIENKELTLYYQPLFDTGTEKVLTLEASVRWQHPKFGIILPEEFMPIAERNGSIIAIGEWILWTACKQNKAWQTQGLPPLPMSLCLSLKQIKQTNIVETIDKILKETKLEAKYLELQLPEHILNEHSAGVWEKLSNLKEMGIKLSLENFGNSINELLKVSKYPIDFLEIDCETTQGSTHQDKNTIAAETILSMAKRLNLQVIANKVKSEAQLNKLKSDYPDIIRGYYLGAPLNTENCTKVLLDKLDKNKD